jgi:hypothetical protein
MRTFGSISLWVGVAGIAVSGATGSACTAKKVTEIIPGATTQIQVPLDIAALRVDILSNGALVSCTPYLAQDGTLVLPTTIGIIPKDDGAAGTTTISVEVRAYDAAGAQSNDLQLCGNAPVGPGGPRLLRRSVQTFVDQRELFLPMPLSYSCFDVDCSMDMDPSDACQGGQCNTSKINSGTLADFNSQLVDGTGICFDPGPCFADAVSAVPVDVDNCIFEFPESMVPAGGLNVRLFYQDGAWVYNAATSGYEQQLTPKSEQEILNEDPNEGFLIPDSTKPQQFQLPKGLCDLYANAATPPAAPSSGTTTVKYHMISDVQMASTCPSKSELLPICAADQKPVSLAADGGQTTSVTCGAPLTLVPAASALYLVMDDSKVMDGAFGMQGYATAMNLTLSSPAFKRTFVGFDFLDHSCGTGNPYTTPKVPFGLAAVAQPKISQLLLSPAPPDSTCDTSTGANCALMTLAEATDVNNGAYAEAANFASGLGESLNVGAVMFFVNRAPVTSGSADAGGTCGGEFSGNECTGVSGDEATTLATAAQTALTKDGLQTFYVVLSNYDPEAGGDTPPLCFYDQVAQLAGQPHMVIDATFPISQAQQAVQNFAGVATGLGTCVYDLPPGVDTSAQLAFTIPIVTPANSSAPVPVPVPYAAGCNANTQNAVDGGTAPNGWNIDGSHIRICGSSCANLQSSVEAVTAVSLADAGASASSGSSVPEVPVTVTMPCANAGD